MKRRSAGETELHSQLQLQVFSLAFGAVQRDGKRGLHLLAAHLAGEVDLQLVVVNWKSSSRSTPGRKPQHISPNLATIPSSHPPLKGMRALVLVNSWALRGRRTLLMS